MGNKERKEGGREVRREEGSKGGRERTVLSRLASDIIAFLENTRDNKTRIREFDKVSLNTTYTHNTHKQKVNRFASIRSTVGGNFIHNNDKIYKILGTKFYKVQDL